MRIAHHHHLCLQPWPHLQAEHAHHRCESIVRRVLLALFAILGSSRHDLRSREQSGRLLNVHSGLPNNAVLADDELIFPRFHGHGLKSQR